MTDHLSAAMVATYSYCPRRAVSSSDREPHIEIGMFETIVRRGLALAAHVRIAKEAYDLTYVIRKLLSELGVGDSAALFERARTATASGLRTLSNFVPVESEAAFGTTIADVRVSGTVDLIARRADGAIVVFTYRTSDIPETAFAVYLALAKRGLVQSFPDAIYMVLGVDEHGTNTTELGLPSNERLERYVRDAIEHADLEPRPGAYCRSCPALSQCPEGRRFLTPTK